MKIATFPGNYASVRHICKLVMENAKLINFSSKDLYGIELAVDEACANIIDHAYGAENIGTIDLFIEIRDDQLRIVLKTVARLLKQLKYYLLTSKVLLKFAQNVAWVFFSSKP